MGIGMRERKVRQASVLLGIGGLGLELWTMRKGRENERSQISCAVDGLTDEWNEERREEKPYGESSEKELETRRNEDGLKR